MIDGMKWQTIDFTVSSPVIDSTLGMLISIQAE